MRKNRNILRIVSALAVSVILITLASCSDKGVYEKTFPSISAIEYNASDYVKIPALSEITLHRSVIDAKIEYALMSILLEDAQYTLYSEKDSADVELYDIVNITYTGVPTDENILLDDSVLEQLSNLSKIGGTNLVIGSGEFVGEYFGDGQDKSTKGFEEQLIGVKVGGVKEITVTYPDDCGTQALRGLAVRFTVTVNSLRRPNIGELSDDICMQKTGYESVAAYRSYLEEYYMGRAAYDALLARCEIIGHCKEIVDVYVDKYIHENIVYAYGGELTEKEYKRAYDEVYATMYDEAYEWAASVSEERVILDYLFGVCEVTLSDGEFDEMLEADWKENGESYKTAHGISDKEGLEKYFGKDELSLAYKFEKLLKVLPEKLNVI